MKARTEVASPQVPSPIEKRRWQGAWWIYASLGLLLCLGIRQAWGPHSASARGPATRSNRSGRRPQARATERTGSDKARPSTATQQKVAAAVNGEVISRDELGQACIARHGEQVLESLVNKHLIDHACRRRKIVISDEDIASEIDRMARRFRLDRQQWLEMLEKERGIHPEQYARDIIWPTLALRRLAAQRLVVTPDEIREAYESQYGPAVKARLIAVDDIHLAREIHARLLARPDEFVKLAREKSQDVGSASVGGLIPPIRKHTNNREIAQVAFHLQEGEVSPIIRVGEQYAIFKCEAHLPARNVPLKDVQESLVDTIRDRKLRTAADEIFRQLQAEATIKNVWNDPQARRQMPNVAATVNGTPISVQTLADESIARHGKDILDAEINQRLLRQALRQKKLQVDQIALDAEIAHAAELAGVIDAQGRADTVEWMRIITEEQGMSRDVYLQDIVWPSAALKKLTEGRVQVLTEDIQKGYAANYGPRVRCRAIVMSNLRRAQEVWDKARQDLTAEHFGDLAEQYSIEPTSRALRGEVPPIKKNSGQPILEKEAFKLKASQLSGVIQVGDKYVILFCEGRTDPIEVGMNEVRNLIYTDIFEKKLRLAMAETFEALRDSAQIDNFLAGTSHAPKKRRQPTRPVDGARRSKIPARAARGPAAKPRPR
ncbi:MAG: peptidylprolyl isomerase [Pirellulales bacterium]